MDIEASNRNEVLRAISKDFDVWEEVRVSSNSKVLRCDLIGISKFGPLEGTAIGFEIKAPQSALNFQSWAKVFKQAADYVDAQTADSRLPPLALSGVFVYPSPPYVPYPEGLALYDSCEDVIWRKTQLLQYAGVIHLAQQFRVGWCQWSKIGQNMYFNLSMGPNPIWNQKTGWAKKCDDLLKSRRIGSQIKKPK